MNGNVKAEERIFEAFIALLKKEDFESISVKKLLIDADVSKATFYRIYEDKYDLLNKSLLFATKKYVEPEKYDIDEWRELLKDLLTKMDDYRGVEYDYPPNEELYEEYAVANRFDSCNKRYDESVNLEIDMAASGCASALYYWIKNDFLLPVEDLIERGYQSIPVSLRKKLQI